MIERFIPRKWRIESGSEIKQLQGEVRKLQALILDDITTVRDEDSGIFVGNVYRKYEQAVKALISKYEGTAEWGVLQTGNIIDVRASFIIGRGILAMPDNPKQKKGELDELKFIHDFMDYNDLDREMAQEFAKEAELEGRFLGQLIWNEKDKMVSLRFRSWATYGYEIKTEPKDYADYIEANWTEKAEPKPVSLKPEDFVYKRFGGRVHRPNAPYPKVAKCLSQIEALDRALRDWREINHLFAAPIPHVECDTPEQAKAANLILDKLNWKVRKVFAHTGRFAYASPTEAGSIAIEKEIICLAKMISGTTGTPVHFLGLPDLMSNRATAENLMELVSASTAKEREIWIGAYSEIFTKAIAIRNEKTQKKPLDPAKIRISIPYVTQEQWDRLEKFWLPAYTSDAITINTFLRQIPGFDVDEELERRAENESLQLEKFKDEKDKDDEKDVDDEDDDAAA